MCKAYHVEGLVGILTLLVNYLMFSLAVGKRRSIFMYKAYHVDGLVGILTLLVNYLILSSALGKKLSIFKAYHVEGLL